MQGCMRCVQKTHPVIFSTEEKDLLPDGGLSVPVLMAQAAWIWYWGGSSWKPGRGGTLCSSIKETDSPFATEMPSWKGSRSPDAGGASDGPRSHLHQATSSAICLPVRILASWILLPYVLLSVCSLAFCFKCFSAFAGCFSYKEGSLRRRAAVGGTWLSTGMCLGVRIAVVLTSSCLWSLKLSQVLDFLILKFGRNDTKSLSNQNRVPRAYRPVRGTEQLFSKWELLLLLFAEIS